jgi:hypothetical protein
MKRQPVQSEEIPVFIGIDYHMAYRVYNVLDVQGDSLGQGRIGHAQPEDFRALVRRWPGSNASCWPISFKTRIIAEAQIKTDKVDARILADLLRGKLVPSVRIVGRGSRQCASARCCAIAFIVCSALSTK